jgi:hypothetical protein
MAINPILAVASKPKRAYLMSYPSNYFEGATFWPPPFHQRRRIEATFSKMEQPQEEVMADRKELKKVNKKL